MTWGVVPSCRQATWPFSCGYCNFSASNIQCPRTMELGIMSCKWNYSVNHGRAWGPSWWKHITARLCLSRVCSLNLPTVRHTRDKSYMTALSCKSSLYSSPGCYPITTQANIPCYHPLPLHLQVASEMQTTKGIFLYPEMHVSVDTGESALAGLDWIHTSVRGTVCLKSFSEYPHWSITNYMSLGTQDRGQLFLS